MIGGLAMPDDDDREEVFSYTVNRWDCPRCGDVDETDADITGEAECASCGTKVIVR